MRGSRGFEWLVLMLLLAGRARAAPPTESAPAGPAEPSIEPRTQDEIIPAAPRGPTEVDRPAGAAGGAHVLLELEISATGEVVDSRTISGEEPFASAAREASRLWQFHPTTRGGRPMRSRIRFEVVFPPLAELAPEPEPQPGPEPARPDAPQRAESTGAPGAAQGPTEVVVEGERFVEPMSSLPAADVRQLAGAFGDPFRAVEALPGVTPIISGLPYYYVRGAPPGNQGFFYDGIRVPLLYHFALGPGVIHPAFVERVDLYPGAYPARYGRYAGAIVAAEAKSPAPELHGEASLRLLDAGAMGTAPFGGGRSTLALGGRYSYTGAIVSLIAPEAEVGYWDYQARTSHFFASGAEVAGFAFGSYDFFSWDDGESSQLASTEFHRGDVRYAFKPDRRTRAVIGLTTGIDRSRSLIDDTGPEGGDAEITLVDHSMAARGSVERRVHRRLTWRAGGDVAFDAYSGRVRMQTGDVSQELTLVIPERNDVAVGVWADTVLEVDPRVTFTPGLRLDLFSSKGDLELGADPRLLAVFALSRRVNVLNALGVAHQAPSFVVPAPGLQLAGIRRLQKAVQHSSGVEAKLARGFSGSVTLFQNIGFDTTDTLSVITAQEENPDLDEPVLAHSVGAELFLHGRITSRTRGLLAYTLSRSTRSFGRYHEISAWDRTHVLQFSVGHDLGKGWELSNRTVVYSGLPGEGRDAMGRLRAFRRLDLRVAKHWRIGDGRGRWGIVLEVLNMTLAKESVGRDCVQPRGSLGGPAPAEPICEETLIGPVTVPSLGVEASY